MQLKDRFLLLIASVAIVLSLFAGVFVIVDNFSTAPIRPAAAIRLPVGVMSERIHTGDRLETGLEIPVHGTQIHSGPSMIISALPSYNSIVPVTQMVRPR